jgi:hypothetical protein
VTNGFGKLVGTTQIEELGTIETPIALTNTLNTFLVANALIDYMIETSGPLRSVNPVIGETNDSGLNDIQGRHVRKEHLFAAIKSSHSGPLTPSVELELILPTEAAITLSPSQHRCRYDENRLMRRRRNSLSAK